MDIEWAKDGLDGELYIVQARPETVASQRPAASLETYELRERGNVLVTDRAVGSSIAAGQVRLVRSAHELSDVSPGVVLVADTTTPDWEPVMKTAGAIVTNRGGRTCHAAIVARELGLPAIIGAEHATERLQDGMQVTVSCAEGDVGKVYAGALAFDVGTLDVGTLDVGALEALRPRSWSTSAIRISPSRPASSRSTGSALRA